MNGGFVVAVGEVNRLIDQLDRDVLILFAQHVDLGIDGFGDGNFGRCLGAEHRKGHDLLAVHPGKTAQFFIGINHFAKVGQHDMATGRQRDGGRGQPRHSACVTQSADRLFARAEVRATGTEVGVGGVQLR